MIVVTTNLQIRGEITSEERAELAKQVGGRSMQQLTPELTADLPPLEAVLFIKALLAPIGAAPQLQQLRPLTVKGAGVSGQIHELTPAELLAIKQALDGHAPEAQVLWLPAHTFDHGTALSAHLHAALPSARAPLQGWLESHA